LCSIAYNLQGEIAQALVLGLWKICVWEELQGGVGSEGLDCD
jgi:hypothetical protein